MPVRQSPSRPSAAPCRNGGHRVEVLALEVENEDATMRIGLKYRIRETGEEALLRFEHQG